MKLFVWILSLAIFSVKTLLAQPAGRGEKIHAIKVAFLTDRLHLTPTQAESFWPVYNQFDQERLETVQGFRQKYKKGAAATENDEQASRFIDDNLELQEQMLALNKKYKLAFLKTISPQQLASLYESERDFRKILLRHLQERRERRFRNR